MRTRNKSNTARPRRDTPLYSSTTHKRNQTNNSNPTGEINRGNTRNIGSNKASNELHTKKSVTGSDADGQAE